MQIKIARLSFVHCRSTTTESDHCLITLNSVIHQNPSRNKTLWEKFNSLHLSCLLYPLYSHACKSNDQNKGSEHRLQWTTKFKKNFVSVVNMLLIYLFASMKLKKGHKKLLGSSFKIMLPL